MIESMKKLHKAFYTLLLIGACCLAINAQAQGGGPGWHAGPRGQGGHAEPGGPMFKLLLAPELELTTDQVTSINSIFDDSKSAIEADATALHTADGALLTYLASGGDSSSSDLATYIDTVGTATKTLRTEEAEVFASAYVLLTDTQKTTLASLVVEMATRSKAHER